MNSSPWFSRLEQADTSYLLLATLGGTSLVAALLYRIGLIGWVTWVLALAVREGIRKGFLLWERLLGWASWPVFLAVVAGFLVVGAMAGRLWPGLRVLFGLAALVHGGHRLPGVHVHRPGTERGGTGPQGRP